MARSITVRFYQIGKMAANGPSLRHALNDIYLRGDPGQREVQLAEGVRCRLERFVESAGFISGEMMRVRNTDFPCEVHPHGTAVLGVEGPIGEGIAFRFREADSRLAIQFDPRVVSPGRFFDYIGQAHGAPLFTYRATMDDAAIRRFRDQPLRKVKIRLASPQELADVENSMQAAASAFRNLGQDYDAPIVTLEIGMGRSNGHLAEGAKQMVEGFLRLWHDGDADVRSVVATSDAGEGIDNEDINLLDHLLSDRGEVVIRDNDPQTIYEACSGFVDRALRRHGRGGG